MRLSVLFLDKMRAPGLKRVFVSSRGKIFGPSKRKRTQFRDGEEAPEKKMNLGPLAAAEATVSSVGRKTMGVVPNHQKQSSSRDLYRVDCNNKRKDF